MASKAFFISLIVLALVVAPALAKDFVVGDENGWKNNNFDYQDWAKDKEFHVGDKLIFNYKSGAHNVHKVDGVGFKACQPAENSEPLTTGNDVVPLETSGRKWYICGVGDHCESGNMKLLITVKEGSSGGYSPSSAVPETVPVKLLAWIVAAASAFMVMIIMA